MLRIWKQLTTYCAIYYDVTTLFEVTMLRIWKQLTTKSDSVPRKRPLFEVTKLRIWKQLTTRLFVLRKVPLLFEVTKLRIWKQLTTAPQHRPAPCRCLRSQSYEFESNSQLVRCSWWVPQGCLRSQSYEFESNSQRSFLSNVAKISLFVITKLRIWKQLTTAEVETCHCPSLFEITKLRIWKQLTTRLAIGCIFG